MSLTHVHTPISIKNVTIKNRVVRTAHTTAIGAGSLSDALIAYHEARARGGVGLSIIEAMSVHRSCLATLNAWADPTLDDRYPLMLERLKPHGMRVFQQLYHSGHHSSSLDGGPSWSASDIPGLANGAPPVAMTKTMIDDVVAGYADTARRAEQWGADGVEVHCAHGFLIQQFLSTYANVREDEYGGDFENRVRFMMEVLTAVRAAVSPTMVVGIRVGSDMIAGGVDTDDNARAARLAVDRQLADYVSVSEGNFQTLHRTIGGMHEATGFELVTTAVVAAAVDVPTILIGRFRTMEEADQVIRSGEADMIGMVRATIADPDLVRKSLEGHPERVRPCIGCNQGCIGQLLAPPNRMGCAVNPAVGFETAIGDDKLVPVEEPLNVLVVGGGPSGMEAARVAALRGHRVTLAEAGPRLGGAVTLAADAPFRAGLRDITTWMEEEIFRLGVDVRLNSYFDIEDIVEHGADRVILACGSMPRLDGMLLSNPGEPIQGMDQSHVISSNDLFLDRARQLGKTAVVIDDVGHYEAVAAAEYLVSQGLSVNFVTRLPSFAPLAEPALMSEPALARLGNGDFKVHVRSRAIVIEREGVVVGPTYLARGTNMIERFSADTVVVVTRNRALNEQFEPLEQLKIDVRLVGDARSPRFLPTAIREGNAAGAAV